MKSLKWQRDEPLKLQFHVITKHTFSRGKKLDRKPGSGLGSGGVSKAGQGEQSTDQGPSIRTPPWVRATEGAGQGQKDWVVTLKRVFICIQRIYSEGLLWAYFRINVVGTYQHLKMWNRRKLRQKMPVCRIVCSKGEVVCVLGCMHELSGLWDPETVQWKEFPEEHPAPTLLRRHSWLSSSPLPSKQGKDRGHWAELLPRLRCRDQAKLKMAPGCGAGLQMNDPGEVPQKSKWVETKHKTKLPLPGWEGKV